MADPADISKDLSKFTRKGKVPALAAAAILNGEIVAAGATGIRKQGDPAQVTVHDKFHIGSCTKSMTGTLAAILVSEGKISWDTTVSEIFPDLKIDPGFSEATLLQLLSNSGGAPSDVSENLWLETVENAQKPEAEQRSKFTQAVLAIPPAYQPGTQRLYSNAGFTIAGAMLEKAANSSFAALLQNRLFKPLGITSAGFGTAATPGKVDQPYGHIRELFRNIPINPGPDGDNPPAISPAGRVHISIIDLARYVNFHLGNAENPPLNREELDFIHTHVPPERDYALGWVLLEREWADGPVLYHNGSNTMNYTVMWLAPKKKFAVVATSNIDSNQSMKACDEAASYLIGKYLTEE